MLCYQTEGRSEIQWTDERVLVLSTAIRADLADLSLYEWWSERSGPVDETLGPSLVRKDVSLVLPDMPQGAFATWVTAEDARHANLRPDTSKVEGAEIPSWDGIWVLDLAEGRWTVAHFGTTIEQGTYALGKDSQVVFVPDSGPCTDSLPAAYRFARSQGEVTWTEVRKVAGACLPGPWPVNLHGWAGPAERLDLIEGACDDPGARCSSGRFDLLLSNRAGQPVGSDVGKCRLIDPGLETCRFEERLEEGSIESTWSGDTSDIASDQLVQMVGRVTGGTGAYEGVGGYGWYGRGGYTLYLIYPPRA